MEFKRKFLKTGAEMAYYVHCFCHRLNLIIVDVVNSVKCVVNMISLFKQLHSFLSSSTVHIRWEKIQEQHKVKRLGKFPIINGRVKRNSLTQYIGC